MWPFPASNKAIIEEKRRQRAEALADVRDASEAQYAFLKATGSEHSATHILTMMNPFLFCVLLL
jgi:hypothetical protein